MLSCSLLALLRSQWSAASRAHGWRGLLTALIVVAPLLTTGCIVQSKVQGRYVEDQGNCRDSAEDNIGKYEKSGMNARDRNAQLVTLFSDCMAKHGWQVARPKRRPTTDGPHGPLDPYGATATRTTTTTTTNKPVTSGPDTERVLQSPAGGTQTQQHNGAVQHYHRAPATQAPVGQRPVRTTTTPLSPSGAMPPLSQPSDGRGFYQPARPYSNPNPGYGTGGGRNF